MSQENVIHRLMSEDWSRVLENFLRCDLSLSPVIHYGNNNQHLYCAFAWVDEASDCSFEYVYNNFFLPALQSLADMIKKLGAFQIGKIMPGESTVTSVVTWGGRIPLRVSLSYNGAEPYVGYHFTIDTLLHEEK